MELAWARALLAGMLASAVAGGAQAQGTDSDHPLVSRYAGSVLHFYGGEPYASVPMLNKSKRGPERGAVAGKISNRFYWGPQSHGAVEVFRNYKSALQSAGFETVYQCELEQCVRDKAQAKIHNWVDKAHWTDRSKNNFYLVRAFQSKPGFSYLHARKGEVHVQVAVRDAAANEKGVDGRALQFVQIAEPTTMEQGRVTVDAAAIGSALKREGRIALYGVLFDTNDARIKTDSAAALAEMAGALKNDAALKVFIVGHTDNQGTVEHNLALSKRRAEAVAEALVRQHGIAQARVQAYGVANLSPVAANGAEEGRARNRRVEMVVR